MADESPASPNERAYRRGFKQKDRRDDYALDLFREAAEHLHDAERVDRVLAQLARLYNAVTDGPIVDLAARRGIMEHLAGGRLEEARALLNEVYALYAPIEPDDAERKPFG